MEQRIVKSTTNIIGDLVNLAKAGDPRLWVDYDKEVDVLYVSFGKPQKADDARQDKDGIIRRTKNRKIIGLTVLDASRFLRR